MVSKFLVLALGALCAAPMASAAAVVKRSGGQCNADNCLRALRASQYPTRLPQASLDCSGLIDVTVTAPVVTVTQYTTISQTNTVTIPTTLVETIHDTFTDVKSVTVTTVIAANQVSIPVKRAATITISSSTSFPAYASPCSGMIRFSSACSCIGVTARTVTASVTPSTTITLPVTEIGLTSIVKVVETKSITTIDATVDATTTVATVTTTVAPVETTFFAQAFFGPTAQSYWLGSKVFSQDIPEGIAVGSPIQAIPIKLDESTGELWSGDRIASGNPGQATDNNPFQNIVWARRDQLEPSLQPYYVTKNSDGFLKFSWPSVPEQDLAFAWYGTGDLITVARRSFFANLPGFVAYYLKYYSVVG